MEWLINADLQLFYWIHRSCSNDVFDVAAPLLRNKFIWIPLYVAIVAYVLTRYSARVSSYLLLMMIGAVIVTDLGSGQVIKKYVKRVRPCAEPSNYHFIKPLVGCSNHSFSFPSSHATNHFGLASLFAFLFGRRSRWIGVGSFSWATIISLSQVYVGIHYPLDVIAGAILGMTLVRIYMNANLLWLPNDILHLTEERVA